MNKVRSHGQVWTPPWVSEAMACLVQTKLKGEVLDPAVGPGALLSACSRLEMNLGPTTAYEIDETALSLQDSIQEYASKNISNLRLENFITAKLDKQFDCIIANPPYLRHHKIGSELKIVCDEITRRTLGISIDARAGLHIYFLIKSLASLKENGELVFIVPADTFEGVFAEKLWSTISKKFRIEFVITLSEKSSAFPGVDTNAVIIKISKKEPLGNFTWCRWESEKNEDFSNAVFQITVGNNSQASELGLENQITSLEKAVLKGFSRSQSEEEVEGVGLPNFARIIRGIATGDNDFFLFTKERIEKFKLDESYFVRTLMRVRDLPDAKLDLESLNSLDSQGRPTYLLSLDAKTEIDSNLAKYLALGEEQGIHKKSLISTRKKWYFMEKREPVPILFSYLGRRANRFKLVETELQPLTGFLCIYPLNGVSSSKLVDILNHKLTIAQLKNVGKSYGDGAVKVEPGGLRKLIIPNQVLKETDIKFETSADTLF